MHTHRSGSPCFAETSQNACFELIVIPLCSLIVLTCWPLHNFDLARMIHEGFYSIRSDTPITRKPDSDEVSHDESPQV